MDKGGRPRKPAAFNNSNNYSKTEKKKMAKVEQELKGDNDALVEVPAHLDDLAKEYYKFIVSELEISGLLGNLDIPLVEQTADCLSKMRQCDEIINKDGVLVIETDRYGNDQRKEHPTVATKNKYLNQFRSLCTQLGMTPSSRAGLAAMVVEKKEQESNPLIQLLSAKEG